MASIALLTGESREGVLSKRLNYYVREGKLQNTRRGIYAKKGYNPEELACLLYTPSYLSLEYVLQKAGVVFQYDSCLTCAGYLSRTVEADGKEYDCISRSFAPKLNVAEDPVCGSGHCHIIPYWAKKLSQDSLTAYQASPRGGVLYCRMDGKRVIMAGKAALYSQAEIYVPGAVSHEQ